jgi:2-C-methyl-D-erythritol 2,4-cyclodiphosphate synthase
MRIGTGYDIHRLVPDRRLILGGVQIPHPKGLSGHSDADVLIHAVCDALLGAAGAGDIGTHFPDSDPRYKDFDSLEMLRITGRKLGKMSIHITNLDATIFAEAPRISPHRRQMEINIAGALKIDAERVNVKATTMEGLGAIGRGEGIAAMCVALVEKDE